MRGKGIKRKRRKEKKNAKGSLILIVLLFVLGIGVLLYPTISDLWNTYRSNQLVTVYQSKVDQIPEERIREELRRARAYNRQHTNNVVADAFTKDKYLIEHPYDDLLNPADNGVMGYLEIPRIQQKLAIFHGTSADVLQKGVGHVKGTSLPVGGKGTHAVLAAHRGLPSAKLFSDLDKMEVGDKFYLTVLNRHLAYQVDQIRIVSPENMEDLALQKESDYVTLLTCTPYGVNTHRLLVRGHRVPYQTHKPIRSPFSKLLHSWQFWLSAGIVSAAVLTGAVKRKRRGRMRKG